MTLQSMLFGSTTYTFLLLCILQVIAAKKISGDFRLSGENSNYLLGTFAVSTQGGKLTLTLYSEHMYANEKALLFRLYRDTEWGAYRKAELCSEKSRFAKQSYPVNFDFIDKKWQSTTTVDVQNVPEGEESPRPHYWYFVLDDCSLELYFQDNQVPKMHYDLNVWNYLTENSSSGAAKFTHLSADERHLTQLHVLTLLLSGVVAFFLFMNILLTVAATKKSIHLALLWVAVSAALDASSSLFELIHLKLYDRNGVGSYSVDALSAHLEAVCDASLVVLLWAIAAGWTLPSDVVAVNANANASPIQKLLQGMSKPVGSLMQFNAAALLSIGILVAHVLLAQWGRIYNDDFESYHDFEHLPGKILMGMRIVAGLLFLIATIQTRAQCQVKQLRAFYKKLAMAGFCWFQSLPALTFLCSRFIPYHLRHPAVFIGSALAQSGSLVFLAVLVTSHTSAYQEYSHMSADQSLTDQLTEEPRTWNVGKTKVRLD